MHIDLHTLKLGLLFFWSLWLTIVFATNAFEGLKLAGVLPERWKFASNNYQAVVEATSVFSPPGWLNGMLFSGVILWQGLAVALFWRAAASAAGAAVIPSGALNTAFVVSLALWAAFMLADEICRAYDGQSSHMMIFISQLVTLLAIHLLPG